MASNHDPGEQGRPGTSRRSFLRTSSGVATGIAVTVLPTVMAYVHDASDGIVTVISGTGEKTYRDPALAKRLLDAAHAQTD